MNIKKEISESYNNYAGQWSTKTDSGDNTAREYLEKPAMRARLPDLQGKSVLAIGCGTGEECAYFKELGANKVVGIDISENLINIAQKNYPDIEFYVMDMEEISLNEKFDFVYSSLVMHYVESWTKTLQNISSVTNEGALFLFSTHHPVLWGAERSRTKDERTSLLGYKKSKKNQTCEVVGDYLTTRKINDVWFDNFPISYFHRSLESCVLDILQSSFQIVDFAEPKAIKEVVEKDITFYQIREKIPLFMIFALRKK